MKLYHATFSKLYRKMKKQGFMGNSPYKLWSDSNNKYIYFASDPYEAESYAETALDDCENERLYNILEDDDIIILEIDSKQLDISKLQKDANVLDGETTYQYEGIIPINYFKIYKDDMYECLRNAGIQIDESVKLVNKEYADTKLITTPSELNEYLKNHTESRFVYDAKKKWYIVADAETSIHVNLLNDALMDGIYEPFEYNGEMINGMESDYKGGKLLYELNPSRFWLFRTSSDDLNGEDYYYDKYRYCYIYSDYCIFDRNEEFKKTTLYQFLGEPEDEQFIGDIDEDESLNEEVIHAEKTEWNEAGMAIVLKNPSKRELRENGLDRCRFICFTDGTWIFFDCMQWIHEHMLNQFSPIYGKGRSGGFYDLDKNEFIFIEPLDHDEGEEGYKEEFKHYTDKERKFLLSYPYITKTFGQDFKIMIYGDWVDNPW